MKTIILNRIDKNNLLVFVDDDIFDYLNQWKWHISDFGYAARYENKIKRIFMHREIIGNIDGLVVDHINGIKIDNRKCNLRLCTVRQNVCNSKLSKNSTTGISGVSFRKDRGKYRAYIMVNRKQIFLGYYEILEEAIIARRIAEKQYFGEFAPSWN